MKKILTSIFILGCFFIATPAMATTYYIDADNGNDAAAGTSAATAWKSFSKINAVTGGDTVYTTGDFGNLGGALTISSTISGTAGSPTLISNLDGGTTSLEVLAGGYTLLNQASYIEFNGIELHNNGSMVASSAAFGIADGTSNITLEGCTIKDVRFGVYALGTAGTGITNLTINDSTLSNTVFSIYGIYTSDVIVTNNTIKDGISTGVFMSGGSTVLVANNYIHGSGEAGAYGASVANFRVINNTLYDNGYGIAGASNTGFLAKNNIISNSSFAAINDNGSSSSIAFDYNLLHNNTWAGNIGGVSGTNYNLTDWQTLGYDEHSFEDDPTFIDASNENFHINPASSAINAGLDLSNYITEDFDAESRPNGTAFDIGADEDQTPDAPATLTATAVTESTIDLSWDVVTTATNYTIQYDTDSGFSNVSESTGNTSTTATLTGLIPNTNYYIRVKTVKTTSYDTYESSYTTITSNAAVITTPEAPSNLRKSLQKVKKLNLKWDAPTNRASYYDVGYSSNKKYSDITFTQKTNTTLKLTKLMFNKKYFFKVRACNAMNECSTYETIAFRSLPKKVTNVKILTNTAINDGIKVRWQKQKRAKSYKIKMTYKDGSKYVSETITVGNNKTWKSIKASGSTIRIKRKYLTGLEKGKKYSVKIRAIFDSSHKGKYSDPVNFVF